MKTALGSLTFSKNQLEVCVSYMSQRLIDVDDLFTHSFGLEQANEGYQLF